MNASSLIKKSSLMMAMAASLTLAASAQEKPAGPTLKAGGDVPSLELEGIEWVQGDPIKTLDEKGKLYIIECWATWCGPCVAVIPHVNELSTKFADKGLVVIGMNVWEDGLDKVQKFVTDKGDGMSYRVAYSGGRSSKFAETWLKPAGARGIPFAFLVRDGKLITTAHPSEITDALVTAALADDFDAETFGKTREEEKAKKAATDTKIRELVQAEEWEKLREFAETELADNPANQKMIFTMVAINTPNWQELGKIASGSEGRERDMLFMQAAFMAPDGEGADVVAKEGLTVFVDGHLIKGDNIPNHFSPVMARARLLWLSGDKDGAKASIAAYQAKLDAFDGEKGQLTDLMKKVNDSIAADAFPPMSKLFR